MTPKINCKHTLFVGNRRSIFKEGDARSRRNKITWHRPLWPSSRPSPQNSSTSAHGTKQSINKLALALMTDSKYFDAIFGRQKAIRRDVTRLPFRDNQFVQVVRGGASDQGVALQHRGTLYITDLLPPLKPLVAAYYWFAALKYCAII